MNVTNGQRMADAARNAAALPLAGCGIVITRPAPQAVMLAQMIRDAGGEPVLFPSIEICDAADVAALERSLARLADYAWAFFVSPNAVEKTFARLAAWPQAVRAAAVGPGTAAALQARGVRGVVTPPTRFDSEGLMAMPQFAAMAGQRCVIFRGNGGRELIASTLGERGATVDLVECYRRSLPELDPEPLLAMWSKRGVHAVTLTSSEGARNFVTMLGARAGALCADTPAFVPHARIAQTARGLGFNEIIETGAADAGLLAALCAHFGGG